MTARVTAAMVEEAMRGGFVAELPAAVIARRLNDALGVGPSSCVLMGASPYDSDRAAICVAHHGRFRRGELCDRAPGQRILADRYPTIPTPLQLDEAR